MASIINLRTERKQRARREKEARAETNRALHSVSAKSRKADTRKEIAEHIDLDAHKLERGTGDEEK